MNLGSIYQITNQMNGKCYIGSTLNLLRRQKQHITNLRRGQHCNSYLQMAFDKYGEHAFIFSILEETKSEILIEREQHYLNMLKPEYNIAPTAGSSLGRPHSPETRRKIGKAHRGKHISQETRRKTSEALTGHIVTEETRRKLSEALSGKRHPMYGKHHSIKTKQKISKAVTGERNPNYGKHLSDVSKQNLSKVFKGRPRSPEICAKISAAKMGHSVTDATRQKLSVALKGRSLSEETKRKISKSCKAYWQRICDTENQ